MAKDLQIAGQLVQYEPMRVENISYDTFATREVVAGTTAAVAGTYAYKYAWVQAAPANTGTVYFGGTGVTIPNGTADTTSGWGLTAGNSFGPLPGGNLNQLGVIATADGQSVVIVTVA